MARRHHAAMLSQPFAVADARTGQVRATCRLMPPEAARHVGFPSERNFDLSALAHLRPRLVEVSGLWIDPEARADRVFTDLADSLARYLIAEGHDFVLATARVGIADGGHTAASMHAAAFARACSPDDLRITPHLPLALERLRTTLEAPASTHLRGWLRMGAWTCGDPCWNRDPHCAEIPLLLPLARLRSRHARRFLAAAA